MADLVDKLEEIEKLLKHQPGRHDQKAHGHRAGGTGPVLEAPIPGAFLAEGNPASGGNIPLPSGWKRTRVDEAKKSGKVGDINYNVSVGYHNGYYASLYADWSRGGGVPKVVPGYGGGLVKWDELQSGLDNLSDELANL